MKYLILHILCFFSFRIALAQQDFNYECGTEINTSNVKFLGNLNDEWLRYNSKAKNKIEYTGPTEFVPVQLHIINQNDGSGGIASSDVIVAFDKLNEYYIKANIHFYQCAPINFIDNSTYYDYDKIQMSVLNATYSVPNVINIYIANTVTSSGSLLCGHAEFPGGLDFVMISAFCVVNGSTLAHEVGHYFGLYHTHESSFGFEAVDGSDCIAQGDLICDTPADPLLSTSNLNKAGCIYFGFSIDENGDKYSPSVTNIMSYTAKECRFTFTEGQKEKLLWTLQNQRTYLTCAIPVLNAFFYIENENDCTTAKQFSFYNASEGNITSYSWDFGDGIGTSIIESPTYTYTDKGIYTVTLTVYDGISSTTYSKKVVVGAVSLPYFNNFENTLNTSLEQFEKNISMKNEAVIDSFAAQSGKYGLLFDGTETTSFPPMFQTPDTTNVFDSLWNVYYKAKFMLCVDATNYTNLQLEFDKKQLRDINDNYTNFRITINGNIVGSTYQVNNLGTNDIEFTHITIDLSSHNEQIFTLGFQGSHKYDKDKNSINGGTATFIDNISITGTEISVDTLVNLPFNYYPNPVRSQLSIEGSKIEIAELRIYNLIGNEMSFFVDVLSQTEYSMLIDVRRLSSGIYILKSGTNVYRIVKL